MKGLFYMLFKKKGHSKISNMIVWSVIDADADADADAKRRVN